MEPLWSRAAVELFVWSYGYYLQYYSNQICHRGGLILDYRACSRFSQRCINNATLFPAHSVCSDSFKEYLGIPKLLLRSTRFLFGNEHDRENRGGTTTTAWILIEDGAVLVVVLHHLPNLHTSFFHIHAHHMKNDKPGSY